MKAIELPRYGAPEVFREIPLQRPVLQAGEVRIEVRFAGVNFADLLQRVGLYASAPRPPYVPGFEVSGVVIESSPPAAFQAGEPVVALTSFGGYASEVVVPQSMVRRLPREIPLDRAAAIPVNYLTAWFCLIVMGQLQAGQRVLIQGGAGGVGLAAIQLALLKGAEVYATAGSEDKCRVLEKLGIRLAINYRRQDFYRLIRESLGPRPLDIVLDAVGGKTLADGYRLLAPLGRLVSYGLSAAADARRNRLKALLAWLRTPRFHPLELIGRNVGVYGFHLALLGNRSTEVAAAFDEILELCREGRLSPVIAEQFPLTPGGVAAAHRFMHERKNIGKVLLASSAGGPAG